MWGPEALTGGNWKQDTAPPTVLPPHAPRLEKRPQDPPAAQSGPQVGRNPGGTEARTVQSRKVGPPCMSSIPRLPRGGAAQTPEPALAWLLPGQLDRSSGGRGGRGGAPTHGLSLLRHHGRQVLEDLGHIQQVTLWRQDGAMSCPGCRPRPRPGIRVLSESRSRQARLVPGSAPESEAGLGSERCLRGQPQTL